AIDPPALSGLMPEIKFNPGEHEAWLKDRTTCLVGRDTALRYGYKVGDRFTLMSGLFPCSIELKVAGTYWGTVDDRNLFFHHKYLDEALGDWGQTGMWWL